MTSSAHAIGKFFNVSMDVRKLRRLPISSNFRETRWRLKSAGGSLTYQIEALRNTNLTSRNLFRVISTIMSAAWRPGGSGNFIWSSLLLWPLFTERLLSVYSTTAALKFTHWNACWLRSRQMKPQCKLQLSHQKGWCRRENSWQWPSWLH